MTFPTNYSSILDRLHATDPADYSKTRNFIDGSGRYLSPDISIGRYKATASETGPRCNELTGYQPSCFSF